MASRGLVLAVLLFAESCWLFALLGLLGLVAAQDGATIPWTGALLILAAGAVTTRLMTALCGGSATTLAGLAAGGLLAVYLAVAAALEAGGLGWPAHLLAEGYPAKALAGIAATVIGAAVLWRRAVRLASDPHPAVRLMSTFRLGILVLALVLIAERLLATDLGTAGLVLPFIAVSLAGLAWSHRPRSPGLARNWLAVTAATVASLIGGALVFGVLGGHFGGPILGALGTAWLTGAAWIAEVLNFLLSPLIELFFALVEYLRSLADPGPRPRLTPPEVRWSGEIPQAATDFVEAAIDYAKYPMLLLILFLLTRFLVRGLRGQPVPEAVSPVSIAHEAIAREGDAIGDLAHILEALLPAWARRRPRRPAWRYPRDVPGISEVFELYFGMLEAALRRGHAADPGATPLERAATLASLLPAVPVAAITERFNAACYGNRPTDAATIERLRAALEAGEREDGAPA